jgi:hypothetical protein
VCVCALRSSPRWLRWADALTWSRAVCLPPTEELAMLPGVDMCNHSVDPARVNARWTVDHRRVSRPFPSRNRSILTEIYLCHACSCQEISRTETAGQGGELQLLAAAAAAVAAEGQAELCLRAGDEVLLSYGPRTPEELLTVHGFWPTEAEGLLGVGDLGSSDNDGGGGATASHDVAVLLVPCSALVSEDEEEELELPPATVLGESAREPSERGARLLAEVVSICAPDDRSVRRSFGPQLSRAGREEEAGTGAGDSDDDDTDDSMRMARALRGLVAALENAVASLPPDEAQVGAEEVEIDTADAGAASAAVQEGEEGEAGLALEGLGRGFASFNRRATAARLYVAWRRKRLLTVHRWCCMALPSDPRPSADQSPRPLIP